jgi:hypothetical protein
MINAYALRRHIGVSLSAPVFLGTGQSAGRAVCWVTQGSDCLSEISGMQAPGTPTGRHRPIIDRTTPGHGRTATLRAPSAGGRRRERRGAVDPGDAVEDLEQAQQVALAFVGAVDAVGPAAAEAGEGVDLGDEVRGRRPIRRSRPCLTAANRRAAVSSIVRMTLPFTLTASLPRLIFAREARARPLRAKRPPPKQTEKKKKGPPGARRQRPSPPGSGAVHTCPTERGIREGAPDSAFPHMCPTLTLTIRKHTHQRLRRTVRVARICTDE